MRTRWKMSRRRVLTLEIAAALIVLFFCIRIPDEGKAVDVSPEDWKSDQLQYADGAWTVSDGETKKDDKLLSGPGVELHHGDYTVTVRYEAQENQAAEVFAGNYNSRHLRGGRFILSKNLREVSSDFRVTQGIGNFELRISYSGSGDFTVTGISIVHNRNGVKRNVTWAVLCLLAVSICILYKKEIVKNREKLLMLAGMVFMISLPLMVRGISDSDYQDLRVHLMRIEGIADQLRLGHVPVRMQSVWLDGYGYPISIYYGDIFLYYPAILRLLGFPVVGAYKAYVLAVNCATALIAWRCFGKILHSSRTAYAAAFAYASSPYRLLDVYIRAAVGEYTSLTFLPLTALAMWQLYVDNPDAEKMPVKNAGTENGEKPGFAETNAGDRRSVRRAIHSSLLLGTSMACIVCTHVLTAEMTAVVLALVCIVCFRRTFTKRVLISLFGAAAQGALLSCWFLVPFLDYYANVTVRINDTVGNTTKMIQFGGAYIGEYFAFFRNIWGYDSWDTTLRTQLTPGIVLMGALLTGIWMMVRGGCSKEIRFLTIFSVLLLFMSSAYFPWDLLAGKSRIGNLLCQIQFPWRYLGIAIVFMSLLLGFIIRQMSASEGDRFPQREYIHQKSGRGSFPGEESAAGPGSSDRQGFIAGRPRDIITDNPQRPAAHRLQKLSVLLCVFTACLFVSSYCEEAQLAGYYDTAELDTYATGGGEYLLTDTLKADISAADIQTDEDISAGIAGRRGVNFVIECKSGKRGGRMTVPVFAYKGYQAVSQDGTVLEPGVGANGALTVLIPPDFDGTVNVRFISPWYWRAAEAVSLAVLLVTIRILHSTRPRRRKQAGRL